MTQTIEAICENGTLRPIEPNSISGFEGRRVWLTIESEPLPPDLQLATEVYAGLSEQEIAELEKIILDRSRFFRNRDPLNGP